MANSNLEWWKTIETHYDGDLENFSDAQTVRIMLYNTTVWLNADDDQVQRLKEHPEIQKEWVAGQAEERAAHLALQERLITWLDKRGIPRT